MRWPSFLKLPQVSSQVRVFLLIMFFSGIASYIALPEELAIDQTFFGRHIQYHYVKPPLAFRFFGASVSKDLELKQGLDILGGVQVVLGADMTHIPAADRPAAIESARQVIERRVNLFGVNEPVVQSSQLGENYRIIVELAGVHDSAKAMQLIGTTAQLDFRLQEASPSATATSSAMAFFDQFKPTGLTGKQLERAQVQFDPKTGEPVVGLQFNEEGKKAFADITTAHTGQVLAIFLDAYPVALPRINTPILDGQAVMTGGFTLEQAKNLSIQLNAGALPVPIEVLEQKNIGASLGQESVQKSIFAGGVGLGLVILFMILFYGGKGFLASVSLCLYAIYTLAFYKLTGVTLTIPGIAGLLLSIGMAVDGNILIFERMKEELRLGRSVDQAMELGFGRAWDSIKDANITTIFAALVLINPLDLAFLNTSGLVRGFGVTLFIGVLISLFTGMIVTRTFMRLFLKN